MKLGIGSYTYPYSVAGSAGGGRRLTALGVVERARRLGVRVVQFCDNLPLTGLSEAELAQFETAVREAGLAVELGTRGLGDAEGLRRHLELAVRLGTPFVRLVVDGGGYEPSPGECVARLREWLPEFRAAGVKLALENHDRFTCRMLEQIIQQTDPEWVGICLDTVNSFGALEGPEVVVSRLARYTLNLHLKDFVIRRVPNQLGFVVRGCPVGEGRLDVPWVLGQLREAGRDVNAIIELWTSLEEAAADAWTVEEAWAEASVRYARQWIEQ
ncbi:sugar phosphate isomerase/epimerase [Fontisphaera persica]|uniref:sugar phosphate isomerase/epimerase family protein n=1 Tax=Fontisphaera persica TaxID=2974023 RepID=UPI0024C0546D|nr:sugar phosphate isomerase/epimerase family protein [Fontisphaera persica]WCJ60199.1 sugar phosphate isomerase/epimerase [Fontisphaera persica]